MNVLSLLNEARHYGATLKVNGERLRVEAPAPLPDALLSELRAHKAELLALLARNKIPDSESIYEWYQERAAIMETDGGLSPDKANRQAWARTLTRFGLPNNYRLH